MVFRAVLLDLRERASVSHDNDVAEGREALGGLNLLPSS